MTNLRVSPLNDPQIPDLVDFAKLIHPGVNNIKDRIFWFSFKNPFLKDKNQLPVLLALNENEKIIGQFMLNNQEWHFQDKAYEGFLGYDFFVEENCRKTGIGALLLIKAVRIYNPFFGLGLTKVAEKLYSVAKIKEIGSLDKFLWLNKPLSSTRHVLSYLLKGKDKSGKSIQQKSFPYTININGWVFELLSKFSETSYKPYYESGVIEFSRSSEFLHWRFFIPDIKYYFYYCRSYNHPLYFIVRNIIRKGLDLLSLVDYKVPLNDEKAWRLIIKLAKKITKDLRFDGLITASSHIFLNKILKQENFFCVGRPSPIVSTVAECLSPSAIINKNAIYVTMADADIDLNFGDN